MSYIGKLWYYNAVQHAKDGMANSVDPDQTAPLGAVWSVSPLFAQTYLSPYLECLWENEFIFNWEVNILFCTWKEIRLLMVYSYWNLINIWIISGFFHLSKAHFEMSNVHNVSKYKTIQAVCIQNSLPKKILAHHLTCILQEPKSRQEDLHSKIFDPSYIISRIQRLEGKQCGYRCGSSSWAATSGSTLFANSTIFIVAFQMLTKRSFLDASANAAMDHNCSSRTFVQASLKSEDRVILTFLKLLFTSIENPCEIVSLSWSDSFYFPWNHF